MRVRRACFGLPLPALALAWNASAFAAVAAGSPQDPVGAGDSAEPAIAAAAPPVNLAAGRLDAPDAFVDECCAPDVGGGSGNAGRGISPSGGADAPDLPHSAAAPVPPREATLGSGWTPLRAGSASPLLAQAGAEPVAADSAAETAAGSGVTPRTVGTQDEPAAGAARLRMTLAPIRWTGNLAESVAWTNVQGQPSRFQNVQSGSVRGSTYLWQPWFAQVAANFGFVSGSERTRGTTDIGSAVDNRTTTLIGGASLSLFPSSRFPFSASFERNDSRAAGILTTEDFTTTRLSLRQDYAPLNGRTQLSFGADRSLIDSVRSGRDTVDVLRGSISHSLDHNKFQLTGNHTANRSQNGDSEFGFDSVNARHTWTPGSGFNLDNFLFLSRSDTRAQSGGTTFTNKSGFADLSSFANWQPQTERPLLVIGSVRLFRLTNDSGQGETSSRTLSAGLSANYSYSQNVSLFGSTQVSQVRSESESRVFTVTSGGGTYTSDVTTLGKFSYTWNGNANATVQSGGQEGAQRLLSSGVGHNLFRSLWAEERSSMAINLGQTVTATHATRTGSQVFFGNSANATWSLRQSDTFNSSLSAGISDVRASGDNATSYTQLNFTANGNMLFSRYATGSANFSVNAIRQDTAGASNGSFTWSAFGNLSYQHVRAFNVPRLRYTLLYTANTLQLDSREQGNLNATRDRVTQALEQRLDYRIGKLDLQGLFRIAQIDGKKNAFIFFRINREFGDF